MTAETHMADPAPSKTPNGQSLAFIAFLGTLALAILTILPTLSDGTHPAALVHPGVEGPSRSVIERDFPDDPMPEGVGHDGQQFYAIARQPMHLDEIAPDLDRPRYRLQRIAYPTLTWALHPSGGGTGLIVATAIVGVAAVFALAYATGALSMQLGGSPHLAWVAIVAPGTFIALRFSMADNLALAAALAAVLLSLSGRHRWAVAAAVLTVLTKESLWLVFLGLLLTYRDRPRAWLAAVPALVGGGWWLFLRLTVTDNSAGVTEFTFPFVGLWHSIEWWAEGNSILAIFAVPAALILGALALTRAGVGHPLAGVIILQLMFLTLLNLDVIGLDANGTRMTAPLLLAAAITLATPTRRRDGELQRTPALLTAPG